MKKNIALFIAVLTSAVILQSCGAGRNGSESGGASVVERKEVIRTYPFSDPDPVPIFARSSMWGQGMRLYPYFFFTRFSATATDKEWTVVRLENPFIRVAVLPQTGGKVWGAADKASNREFLYTNHVMKFREIAMRGPWTSGGIEFNFGIVGHTATTASPVDYVLRRNPDGSASCVVGTMDLPSRTRWSITITLPKDKAYFETNGFWHNPTAFSQSYYYWSCAAIKAADDLRYIFPGLYQIGHDYSVPLEPWPVSAAGLDLSWYRNNDSPGSKSYFTVGEYSDFYGAWYKNSDAGFAHWALYDDMPGRKIWIWDLSRQGAIWVDLLTDKDGQYSEPQAGRLLNQSDHSLLFPSITDRWKEIWFPYQGIGPLQKASPIGALSAAENETGLALGFFPVQPVDEDITVSAAGAVLFKDHMRLKPEELYKKDVPLKEKPDAWEVRIGDKLVYSSDRTTRRIGRPLRFRAVDESTAEGLFMAGLRFEQSRSYHEALQKYLACLAKAPVHLRALSRTAELYARRGEYEIGLGYAAKALENSMYDADANYVYGLIARRMGRLTDAKETFGWAARSMEYRSPAYVQLAEIAALDKNFPLACEYAGRARDFNRYNSSAYEILAAVYRRMGKTQEARAALDELEGFDPLDHLVRFERYLLQPTDAGLTAFKSMIRNELPHESYLEMALFYIRLGFGPDALTLLENSPAHPEVYAWRAYLLKNSAPDESRSWLDKSLALSPLLVFPFREESIPVFEWAMAARPTDWKPKYYLGLIFWGKGRIDETINLFDRAGDADFAPFFLARASLHKEAAPARALADLGRALDMDRKNWRVWHELIDNLRAWQKPDDALSRSREAATLFPDEVPVQVDLVKSLIAKALYAEAAQVIDRVRALPYEGASEIHGLYVDAHIGVALERMQKAEWSAAVDELEKSKLFPESLGTGTPFAPDVRVQDYLAALCREKLGDKPGADKARQAVLDFTLNNWNERGPGAYFGALLLERTGQRAKAGELLKAVPPPHDILNKLKAVR